MKNRNISIVFIIPFIIFSLAILLYNCSDNKTDPNPTNNPPNTSPNNTLSGLNYPVIKDFNPKICYKGSNITITGKHFLNESPKFIVPLGGEGYDYKLLVRTDTLLVVKLPLTTLYVDSSKVSIQLKKIAIQNGIYYWNSSSPDTIIYSEKYLKPVSYYEIWPLFGTKGDVIRIKDYSGYIPTIFINNIEALESYSSPYNSYYEKSCFIPDGLSEGLLPISMNVGKKASLYNPEIKGLNYTNKPYWFEFEPKNIKASDTLLFYLNKTIGNGNFNTVNVRFYNPNVASDTATVKFDKLKRVTGTSTTTCYKLAVPSNLKAGTHTIELKNLTDSKVYEAFKSPTIIVN